MVLAQWREFIGRQRVNPSMNEFTGWSLFGWKFGKYYEGRVLQNMEGAEDVTRRVGEEMGIAALEILPEERTLRQEAMRWVGREMDPEVAKAYWGDKVSTQQIVDEWRRQTHAIGGWSETNWGYVAPFRLPKPGDPWIWWKGQNEPGLVALPADNDKEPITVGPGRNVLVVTDSRGVEKGLKERGSWHATGDQLRQILISVSGAGGTLNVINVREFERLMTDRAQVDMLAQFSSVLVGATLDVETPTRLARTWCGVSGWRPELVDEVALAWLGVIEYEKLMLDLTSLEQCWVTT